MSERSLTMARQYYYAFHREYPEMRGQAPLVFLDLESRVDPFSLVES